MLRFVNNLQQYAPYLDCHRVATKCNQSKLEARGEVDEITVILSKVTCTLAQLLGTLLFAWLFRRISLSSFFLQMIMLMQKGGMTT